MSSRERKKIQKRRNQYHKLVHKMVVRLRRRFPGSRTVHLADPVQKRLMRKIDHLVRTCGEAYGAKLKEMAPELSAAYFSSTLDASGWQVCGYDWHSSGSPELEEKLSVTYGIDARELMDLKPHLRSPVEDDVPFFVIFPKIREFVCFLPGLSAIASRLARIQNPTILEDVIHYLGFTRVVIPEEEDQETRQQTRMGT